MPHFTAAVEPLVGRSRQLGSAENPITRCFPEEVARNMSNASTFFAPLGYHPVLKSQLLGGGYIYNGLIQLGRSKNTTLKDKRIFSLVALLMRWPEETRNPATAMKIFAALVCDLVDKHRRSIIKHAIELLRYIRSWAKKYKIRFPPDFTPWEDSVLQPLKAPPEQSTNSGDRDAQSEQFRKTLEGRYKDPEKSFGSCILKRLFRNLYNRI